LYVNYSAAEAYLGGGHADGLDWIKKIAFADGTGSTGTWSISITGSAGSAGYAASAAQATHAASANYAQSALTASYAVTALRAISAGSAGYAASAANATYAASSNYSQAALTASYAVTALRAISAGSADYAASAANATNIYSSASTTKAYVLGTTTASSANHATVYNASVYTSGSVLYGAAWNDYAEYRRTNVPIQPGRCVREVGDDTLVLTTKRLERGCEIVSDTFGFAIGETEECKTPIATTGRVLVYIYEGRAAAAAHIGWPVCSGPNGTVSIMTEEEEEKYPSCIIGTISAIPDYETWGTGNVKVNGRVWIRIR